MFRTHLTSKGQVTVPKRFRQRMKLTGKRAVTVDQRDDGSVVIRPVKSIMHLAGTFRSTGKLISPQEERRLARKAWTARNRPSDAK
jgi:bifunctional DNA-binding transcriptional regulator/antitoxin component of YhaV-PrlF toxin-antitoxin module